MKLKSSYGLLLLMFFFFCLPAKVLIFTYSYNRPDFIEIQYKTFKKFMKDEYEFIVFNDAFHDDLCNQIEQMCAQYNIRCIRMPQELHDSVFSASIRNCTVVNYSLNVLGFDHDDIVMLIDSDMFLIKDFSVREYLKDFDIAGYKQIREHITYIWVGIVFINMNTLPNKETLNFSCGLIDDIIMDSGGYTYYYFKNNPQAHIKYFDEILYLDTFHCSECKTNQNPCIHAINLMQRYSFSNPLIRLAQNSKNTLMELFVNQSFLHYRGGTNWNGDSEAFHNQKTQLLSTFIEALLKT